jgi:hypothetical protein
MPRTIVCSASASLSLLLVSSARAVVPLSKPRQVSASTKLGRRCIGSITRRVISGTWRWRGLRGWRRPPESRRVLMDFDGHVNESFSASERLAVL